MIGAFRICLRQRIALQVEVLVEGGNAGISDEHVGIVNQARLIRNRNPVIFSRHKRGSFRLLEPASSKMPGKRLFYRRFYPSSLPGMLLSL